MIAPSPDAQAAPAALRIASFPELVALAGEKRDLLTKAALEADVRLVRIEDGRLEVALERSAARTLVNDLSRKLEQWTGRRWTVIVSNEAGTADAALAKRSRRRTSASAPPKPIRGCRRCWRDFPAPRWSRCASLPRSRRNPMLAVKTLPRAPTATINSDSRGMHSMADFLGMMKQAAQLQSKMQAMQEELGHVEVEGISGGGLVSVRMTAKMEVKAVKIDPSLIKADEREILEDLLVTAHNDARRKAEAAMQEKMQALTGGLGLPPGLGLT